MKRGAWIGWAVAALAAMPAAAQTQSSTLPAADALYEIGRNLFEELAPDDVKAEYKFPSAEQWQAFGQRLEQALQRDSIEDLAAFLPEARAALTALRAFPGYENYADWLEQRIDEIEVARQLKPPGPAPNTPAPAPRPPATPLPSPHIPLYDVWLQRVKTRPVPSRAEALMPGLRAAFTAEGIPPELAWLAEAESSFNPAAGSPAGAKGLFQLMPATAQSLGLETVLPDERTDPEKSARAAARYLRLLHGRFGDWPLALAAYNAGQGRVGRTLATRRAKTFAEIADGLPAETRMYVPKVCALIADRAGVPPEKLAAPRAR